MEDSPAPMPGADSAIDAAVHATELKQKAGGAVVVPQREVLPHLSTADVQVQDIVDPAKPQLELIFHTKKLESMAFLIAAALVVWCAIFMEPHSWTTYEYDARKYSIDDVVEHAKDYDEFLGAVRSVLSNVIGDQLKAVIAAVSAPSNVLIDGQMPTGWRFLTALIPIAVGLPLSGFEAQVQFVRYHVAIGTQDLGKYDMLVSRDEVPSGDQDSELLLSTGSMSNSFEGSEIEFYNETLASNISDSLMNATHASSADTILRRAMLPPRNQVRSCSISGGQRGNEYTTVAYDFMTNDWQLFVLSEGVEPVKTFTVPVSPATDIVASNYSFNSTEVTLMQSLFTRAAFLYADSALFADAIGDEVNGDALKQLKLDTISYAEANATADPDNADLERYVRDYFASRTAWQDVIKATVSDIVVEYSAFNLSDHVQFASVTLTIPINNTVWHRKLAEVNGELVEQTTVWPGSGDVVYEIDVSNECGPRSCGVQNRGLAPEPKVVAFGDCSDSGGLDCSGDTRNASMWLAGFGRRIEGEALELLESSDPKLRKAALRNPREYHQVTMGYLTFDLEDLDKVYNAECRVNSCLGLRFPFYDASVDQTSALLVGFTNTPMIDFGSSFDLLNNLARGRRLVTRYTTGTRVEYEILQPNNFDVYNWTEALQGENCSGLMERSIITNDLNHLFIEDPLQTTYTAGLFFVFQDARAAKLDTFSDGEEFLELLGSDKWYGVSLVVPVWQGGVGIFCGGLLLILLVGSFMNHERNMTRLASAPLNHPSVLMRALADSTVFPSSYIDVKASLPADNGKGVLLRGIEICSVAFGPVPPDRQISTSTIVIQQDTSPKKETTG